MAPRPPTSRHVPNAFLATATYAPDGLRRPNATSAFHRACFPPPPTIALYTRPEPPAITFFHAAGGAGRLPVPARAGGRGGGSPDRAAPPNARRFAARGRGAGGEGRGGADSTRDRAGEGRVPATTRTPYSRCCGGGLAGARSRGVGGWGGARGNSSLRPPPRPPTRDSVANYPPIT
jgi:hypothetical protein